MNKQKVVPPGQKKPDKIPKEKTQKRLFKKTRAGIVLTKDEVQAIKLGRRKLRKELKARGIKSRKEFELTASSLMLYFDKQKRFGLLIWLFHGRGLWALAGALAALLLATFAFSLVSQIQGMFTINMSDGMFREGFSLSETKDFDNPTMRLFCEAVEEVPCFSITDIHSDVNDHDGQHNEAQYFAYTYYIRNEGESTVGYNWSMRFTTESRNLSDAVWIIIFEDDRMKFYAKAREDGIPEALPAFDDSSYGFLKRPFYDYSAEPEEQFQVVTTSGDREYYRLVPYAFESEEVITTGYVSDVEPMEVHKYTVVIWLEGDDPDCTDDLIGGHAGMDMHFYLVEEDPGDSDDRGFSVQWDVFWDNLIFWDD